MSGGSFDYAYIRIQSFSEELNEKLDKNEYSDLTQQTKDTLRYIAKNSEMMSRMMKEVEWLYSGDIIEDSFLNSIQSIISIDSK